VGSVQKSSTSPVRVTQRGYRLTTEITLAGQTREPEGSKLTTTSQQETP
jgi:hypothetical protein